MSDNIDDDRSITADTQPDTDTVATYIIDYNGADSSANDAVTVSRTVNVIDTTAPIISLNGSAFVEVGQGATYTDAGANATDNNDLSVTVTPSGSVNTSVIGSYTITYNAIDTAGNAASPVFRTVNVVDNDAPIITLLGQAVVTHVHGTPFVDSGASAVDAVDGSVSVTISGSVNVNAIGSYTLTYSAQDSNGNDATPVTRTVNVVDQTKPTITLLGSATINHQQYEAYTDAGVTVFDNVDGSGLTATPSGSVNVNAVGQYTITYTATDSAGNIAEPVTRTINVVSAGDITPPVISLVGDATVLHEQGTVYTDAGATALDNIEGDISADIVVNGGVNVNIADTYTITYTVSDSDGNSATPTTRTVVVQDTLKPAINLFGGDLTLNVGDSFTDSYEAVDPNRGNLTSNVVRSGSVNTSQAGTYTLRYNVSDSAGNAADQKTRTVTVLEAGDVTPPVITLLGELTVSVTAGNSFVDEGALITDNVDGARTIEATSGSVNSTVAGVYTLYYDAQDSAGNVAAQVYRVVIVTDAVSTDPTVRPTISTSGSTLLTLLVGDAFVLPSWTATDDTGAVAIVWDRPTVDTSTESITVLNATATNIIGSDTATLTVRVVAQSNSSDFVDAAEVVRVLAGPTTTYIHDGKTIPTTEPMDTNGHIWKQFNLSLLVEGEVLIGTPVALINDQEVTIGESVDGLTFQEIQTDGINRVKLRLQGAAHGLF